MTKRIFRSILAVSAFVFLVGLALLMGILFRSFQTQMEKELSKEANYLATLLATGGDEVLQKLPKQTDRVTLIDEEGNVLFDNTAHSEGMENHADREEIKKARQNGAGVVSRYSNTLQEKTVYYALRLSDGRILRVSGTQDTVVSMLFDLVVPIAGLFLLMVILSVFFASRAAKKIVAPLNSLNLDEPAENEIYEEVAPLLTKISRQQRTIYRQLEKAKRQQEEFSLITEHMGEGIVVIDKQAEILSYNPSALRLLGAEGNFESESVLTLERSEPFRSAVEAALSGQHFNSVLERDGLDCRISANPVRHDGEIAGAVLLLVDVTEKTQGEKLRREFTANVSHELKTPLTSISGFAEILHDGMVKPEDTKQIAGRIFKEAQRLIALVGDVVKISQLDEGCLPYETETVELSAVIGQVLESVRPAAEKAKVSLHIEGGPAELATVKPILEEVVYNLCDNAVKYNRRGGSVTVLIRQDEAQTEIVVSDTGIGISPADQKRIFERFYRADKSHSKEIGGTGLGLSIVKHGAAFLGAEIDVDSVPGVGSSFFLRWEQGLKKEQKLDSVSESLS